MRLQTYFGSMAGRLFLFLLVGVVCSASVALALAHLRREADLRHFNMVRVVDRIQDVVALFNNAAPPQRAQLVAEGALGLRPSRGTEKTIGPDEQLSQMLGARIGPDSNARRAVASTCLQSTVAAFDEHLSCWIVTVPLLDRSINLVALSPRANSGHQSFADLLFLSTLAFAVALLAFFAVRMATAPLGNLSRAARALAGNPDGPPLAEVGPSEVRDAIRAFNAMQTKLHERSLERSSILASITHDLQTPLTRLRLRLEKVDDPALRSRLIDDLAHTQELIRQGLDFYRGARAEEAFVPIALDTLLETIVEDANETDREAMLASRSGYDVEAPPRALQRCLANLLDNALKYGGRAEVSAAKEDQAVRIRIRDFGPGIPEDKLEAVFEPFVRLDSVPHQFVGGMGLGLAIARTLAHEADAELTLANHPDGGLEACLVLRRGLTLHAGPTDQAITDNRGVTLQAF